MTGASFDTTEPKQAEKALAEQKRLYQSITDNASVALLVMDEHQHCIFMNPAAEQLTGYSFTETQGRPLHEIIHHTRPDGRSYPLSECPIDQAFPERNRMQGEEVFIHKDGHFYHVAYTASPLLEDAGNPVGTVIEIQDITSRKKTEAERYKFFSLAEQSTEFIGICDMQFKPFYVNPNGLRLMGLDNLEQACRTEVKDFFFPEDHDFIYHEFFPRVLREGHAEVEIRFRHFKTGQPIWMLYNVFHLRGAAGDPVGLATVSRNVTDRKQAEEAVRESEERVRAFLEHSAIIAWVKDEAGRHVFLSSNYERHFGVSSKESNNKTDFALWPQEGEPTEVVESAPNADGSMSWWLNSKFTFRDAHGRRYVGGLGVDITERKQVEMALRQAQARLQRWNMELEQAVNVKTAELQQSQERLRGLTSELNLAEQRERKRLATELHDHLQQLLVVGKLTIRQGKRSVSGMPIAQSLLERVDGILSDALTYSRTLVAELSPPILREHGLAASLHWLAEYMKNKHEHTVTVFAPDDQDLDLPEDQRILLFQSVRELLINSAKHAGTGQAILTMERRMDDLCITVKDEGKGFDPTIAAAAGASNSAISSGFGLYSIQERMRALGGSFEVQSAPDKGSSAILLMPLPGSMAKARTPSRDLPISSRRSKANIVPHDASTIRVLLVDDHVMIRQGLRTMLEAQPDVTIVGEAANGQDAIALVHTIQADVVLMDINMPKLNGIEATAVIKQHFPHMAIVGLSVNADRGSREAMIQAGAATLLTKEAPVEELYHAIQLAVKARTCSDSLVESSPSRKE